MNTKLLLGVLIVGLLVIGCSGYYFMNYCNEKKLEVNLYETTYPIHSIKVIDYIDGSSKIIRGVNS